MPGITDLQELIRTMQPVLQPGSYVFCTVGADKLPATDQMIGMFKEREGFTVIVAQEVAHLLGLSYDFVAAWITLEVHSSLAAVGLTAAFATALAKVGISCNVVAGYYHDHLFVAKADGERAMAVLQELAQGR